jgi:hypothetical protein
VIHIDDGCGFAKCRRVLLEGDAVVVAALQSECEDCRTEVMVGPPSQRGCAVKPALDYVPEPLPDADLILAEVRLHRDAEL